MRPGPGASQPLARHALLLEFPTHPDYGPSVMLDMHLADALALPFDLLGVGDPQRPAPCLDREVQEVRAGDPEAGAPLRGEPIGRSLAG